MTFLIAGLIGVAIPVGFVWASLDACYRITPRKYREAPKQYPNVLQMALGKALYNGLVANNKSR